MKKSRELSVRDGRAGKKEKDMKRRKIDFSDITELSEKQLSSMRRVGRPPLGDEAKRLIAIRLDAKVLRWIRKTADEIGRPYQSLINDILEREMKKAS